MEFNEPPDTDTLTTALEPFRGDSSERPKHVAVEHLIRLGYITFETDTYPKREIPAGWITDHKKVPGNTDTETDDHVRLKIHGARYLRGTGHEVDTQPISNPSSNHLSAFSCFEESRPEFTADVVCSCDDCTTVVEAGYTPPQRLLTAFGYSFGLDEDACLKQDEHNPISARTRDYYADGFYTIPYGGSSDRVEVYKFEPTEKMPEADMQALSESALSVLDTGVDTDTP